MYWRPNVIIWFDLRVITFLTGTTAVTTVAHSPKPQKKLTILFFNSKKKVKIGYFSLFSEFTKIDCGVDFAVRGSTTKCLEGGTLSSCKCCRVVGVPTVFWEHLETYTIIFLLSSADAPQGRSESS